MGDWAKEIEKEPSVYPPVHPGEMLQEEFLEPLGMTAHNLAAQIGASPAEVEGVLRGERAVDRAIALKLSRRFGTTERFWLGL